MNSVEQHLSLWTHGVPVVAGLFAVGLGVALTRPSRGAPSLPVRLGLAALASAVVIALYVVSFRGYIEASVAPQDALEITANAQNWQWTFSYPDGKSVDDALRVPAGRPVHVTVRSHDLIERVEIPALGVDTEASPTRDGSLWFVAPRPGDLTLFCGDACNGHPAMVSTVKALDSSAWDDWGDDGAKLPPAEYGHKLYVKNACIGCHSLDGKAGNGPTWLGLYGRHEVLSDNKVIVVDDAYIKESILNPTAKVVRGFQPIMPPFEGRLNDKQIAAIIAFIKTVKS